MRFTRYSYLAIASVLSLSLFVQGVGGAAAAHPAAAKLSGKIIIGQITSMSGAFSPYGTEQIDGFQAGLHYATGGSMKVDNAKIVVKTYTDVPSSGTLPDTPTAVTAAKTAIQQDHAQILQCCASSASAIGVATVAAQFKKILMVAPAADDSLAGINRYTFRTSRESTQDALTGAKYAVQKFGKKYVALAQDYAFGHGQVDAWKAQLDKLGATDADSIFFPLTATDFTPYIQRILAAKPDWVFLACAGTQCVSLAKALDAQGVLDSTHVMTGLGNIASFGGYGDAGTKLAYISVYYYKFPKTAANKYLVSYIQKHYHRPADIFDQDSFAAAQQIVAALQKTHSTAASKMIKALEGQTVQGPKGPYTIRKQDHVCLQPMYIAALQGSGTTFTAKLLATRSPKQTTPPIQKRNW
ncbi:MAG TPA: substrate-binding domain-containing protein [Chloroflexota bacterium]|nr:substrate-binding domain-containing protein [Chloroflexota bacterium]